MKRRLGRDCRQQVILAGRTGTDDLLGRLLPGDGLLQKVLLLVAEEAQVDEDLDELWEAGIAKGAANDCLRLGDVVPEPF